MYGYIVATLAMVEEPSSTAILRTSPVDDNDPDAPLPPYSDKEEEQKAPLIQEPLVQQEVLLIKQKPITASLRGTVRHLKSRNASPLRGLKEVVLYFVAFTLITSVFNIVAPGNPLVQGFGVIIAVTGLTRLSMLWTHIVISEPSQKRWTQRFVSRKVAKKALLPTFATAMFQLATPIVPAFVYMALNVDGSLRVPLDEMSPVQRSILGLKTLAVASSGLLYFLCIVVPSSIALVRVYAALLPEDETPIVSFDRTFGGLVVPESEGGNGKLMLLDAWKSFDWNARVRLIKVWAKMTLILALITVMFLFGFFSLAMVAVASINKN